MDSSDQTEDDLADRILAQLPDHVDEELLLRVLGSILTAYSPSQVDAFSTLRVLAVQLAAYYAETAPCNCSACREARRKVH